jgi:hypothetical protein
MSSVESVHLQQSNQPQFSTNPSPQPLFMEEKRRSFQERWKCAICFELPVSPFQTACGHCMCRECAERLPANAGNHTCPLCKTKFSGVFPQPQLSQTLEELAEFLWPKVMRFWRRLKAVGPLNEQRLFGLIAPFVDGADDTTIAALRLLRLSLRYAAAYPESYPNEKMCCDAALEPLQVTEAGEKWDGVGPWLERMVAKCSEDRVFCFVAISGGASSMHASVADRLIPILAQVTFESEENDWVNKDILADFSAFARRHIQHVPRGWTSLIEAPGFSTLAPIDAVAALFAAEPSAQRLSLLISSIKAQCMRGEYDDEEEQGDAEQEEIESKARALLPLVTGTVAGALASCEAFDAALDVAVVRLMAALCEVLPAERASEVIREHGLLPFGGKRAVAVACSEVSAVSTSAASSCGVGQKRARRPSQVRAGGND